MDFSPTPNPKQIIRDHAQSGDTDSANEVLRTAIHNGDDALVRGDYTDLKSDQELDAFFAELKLASPQRHARA